MSANVIKARALEATGQSVIIRRNVQSAQAQANEIVTAAQREAERILARAEDKAEQLIETAQREGYQNGLAQWNQMLASAWRARDEFVAKNETSVLQLSVQIARKLLGDELKASPEKIASVVREALKAAQRAKTFVIQVHPADVALVKEHIATLQTVVGPARDVEVISSPVLVRGDCVIESDIGIIDARLETQLGLMEKALMGVKSA